MLCCTSTTVQMNYTYSKHMVRACSWFFLFLFVLFLCIACRISSGGAHDLVAYASSGSGGGGGSSPLLVFPSLFVRTIILDYFSGFLPFLFLVRVFVVSFSLSTYPWVAGVRMFCLSYLVRWHGIALPTPFTASRCTAVLAFNSISV